MDCISLLRICNCIIVATAAARVSTGQIDLHTCAIHFNFANSIHLPLIALFFAQFFTLNVYDRLLSAKIKSGAF